MSMGDITEADADKIEALEQLRKKLLDFSLRNRLLNFRDTGAKVVKIVDELPEQVFEHLVIKNRPMTLAPMVMSEEIEHTSQNKSSNLSKEKSEDGECSPEDFSQKLKDAIAEAVSQVEAEEADEIIEQEADANDIEELPDSRNDGYEYNASHGDDVLQTTLSYKAYEGRLHQIHSDYLNYIESTGSNMLFLAVGFLKWHNKNKDTEKARLAPLVLIPVNIDKVMVEIKSPSMEDENEDDGGCLEGTNKVFRYQISYSGDDFENNLTLSMMLKDEYGIELPQLSEEEIDNPLDYFDKVNTTLRHAIIPTQEPWGVVRQIRLGFFTFGKDVMYRDLDPSNWKKHGLINNRNVSVVLIGDDAESMTYSEDDLAEDDIEKCHELNEIPTVLDADSSQMKVLMRISKGESLVVQGPPGTGKSQTITNMIATALASGKRVLFMAEKLAALNVVSSRLAKVGLKSYCLELHSRKSSAKEILGQIQNRVRGSQTTRLLDYGPHLKKVNSERLILNSHCQLMKIVIPELGMNISELLWSADAAHCTLLKKMPAKNTLLPPITDDNTCLTKEQLSAIHKQFETIQQHWSEGMPKKAAIWESYVLTKRLIHADLSVIEHYLCSARKTIQTHVELQQNLSQIPLALSANLIDILRWNDSVNNVPPLPHKYNDSIGKNLVHGIRTHNDYVDFLNNLKIYNNLLNTDSCEIGKKGNITDGDIDACISSLKDLFLRYKGSKNQKLSWIESNVADLNDSKELLQEISNKFYAGFSVFGESSRILTLSDIVSQTELICDIFSLQLDVAGSFSPIFMKPNIKRYYDKAHETFLRLKEKRAFLSTYFSIDDIPESLDIKLLQRELKEVKNSFFSWLPFGRNAQIKKKAKFIASDNVDVLSSVFISELSNLQVLIDEEKNFSHDQQLAHALGVTFKGSSTDWDTLISCIELAERIKNDISDRDIRSYIESNIREIWDSSEDDRLEIQQIHTLIERFRLQLSDFQNIAFEDFLHLNIDNVDQILSDLVAEFSTLSYTIKNIYENADLSLDAIYSIFKQSVAWRESQRKILKFISEGIFLGKDICQPEQCNVDDISKSIKWAVTIINVLPDIQASWLLNCDTADRISIYLKFLSSASSLVNVYQSQIDKLQEFGEILPDSKLNSESLSLSSEELLEILNRAIADCNMLIPWSDYQHACKWLNSNKNTALLDYARKHNLDAESLHALVEYAFFKSWVDIAFQRYPELWSFSRAEHEVTQNRFRIYDRDLFSVNQKHINKRLYVAPENMDKSFHGNAIGKVSTFTGWGLINHELGKKQRHVPVRSLIRRSGKSIQKLMPCWMMGPASVAQFLPPEQIEFDLVIMDEASQIRPEDSLGSIARARQIVVVGDSKQMPPTNSFSTNIADGGFASTDMKSILDLMTKHLKQEYLCWHYRSEHQNLILFSNENYYESRLIIPPTAKRNTPDLGIKWHAVRNPSYHNSINENEAGEIIAFAAEHIKKNSILPVGEQESLGIVAMNEKQGALLSQLLDNLKLKDSALDRALSEFCPDEPLFIRNLENVQGDERDVIIIGITYGPDMASGKVYQRFGPINNTGGWRRLNVLFTRSRRRIHVFSSMRYTDVQVPAGERQSGCADLRAYLEFAETGILPSYGIETGGEPDSPFEIAVAHELSRMGYEAHYQVGVKGFKIDIGVVDPRNPGIYLCGIECDGATYHSSPVARDRDRLRQEILEARGWKIYRIWSSDWFKSRDFEVERMQKYLASLYEIPIKNSGVSGFIYNGSSDASSTGIVLSEDNHAAENNFEIHCPNCLCSVMVTLGDVGDYIFCDNCRESIVVNAGDDPAGKSQNMTLRDAVEDVSKLDVNNDFPAKHIGDIYALQTTDFDDIVKWGFRHMFSATSCNLHEFSSKIIPHFSWVLNKEEYVYLRKEIKKSVSEMAKKGIIREIDSNGVPYYQHNLPLL